MKRCYSEADRHRMEAALNREIARGVRFDISSREHVTQAISIGLTEVAVKNLEQQKKYLETASILKDSETDYSERIDRLEAGAKASGVRAEEYTRLLNRVKKDGIPGYLIADPVTA